MAFFCSFRNFSAICHIFPSEIADDLFCSFCCIVGHVCDSRGHFCGLCGPHSIAFQRAGEGRHQLTGGPLLAHGTWLCIACMYKSKHDHHHHLGPLLFHFTPLQLVIYSVILALTFFYMLMTLTFTFLFLVQILSVALPLLLQPLILSTHGNFTPLYDPHSRASPFPLYTGTIQLFFKSFGILPSLTTALHTSVTHSAPSPPETFNISTITPEGPAAFPDLILAIADFTASTDCRSAGPDS